jgi:hypothetical protein
VVGPLLAAAVLAASFPALGAPRVEVSAAGLILEAPPELRGQAQALAGAAATLLPRLEASLGVRAASPYRIFLLPPGPLDDPDLARLDASAPAWAAGFLLPGARVGAIRVAQAGRYPYGDLQEVLVHEAVHMLLHDAAGGTLPRWFEEGVATRLGRRWGARDTLVYAAALLTRELPSLAEMDRGFRASEPAARAAYAASFDFVSWTVKRHGDDVLRDIVAAAATRPFPEAWAAATGVSLRRAEVQWRRGSLLRYRWVPVLTGTTTLWIGITLLASVALSRRRARARRIQERWEREEGGDAGGTIDGP